MCVFLCHFRTLLQQQIDTIKKSSEARLEALKQEYQSYEQDLQEVENNAVSTGIQSTKERQEKLSEKQQRLRQMKEKTEAMEALAQDVVAGLAQISDILCIPKSEEEANISNVVHEIEAVLDTLMIEREKQVQQQQQGNATGGPRDGTSSAGAPEAHTNRSPELDMVVAKHESPTVRLPKKLPTRPESDEGERAKVGPLQDELHWNRANQTTANAVDYLEDDDDDEHDEGYWNRSFVKSASLQIIKADIKKGNKAAGSMASVSKTESAATGFGGKKVNLSMTA